MTLYDDPTFYSDAALIAEIQEYRAAIKEVSIGGIAVIQGEGRRLEFTRSGVPTLQAELRDMMAAAARRGLISVSPGGAIPVEIR
jgi:hypothetical protein